METAMKPYGFLGSLDAGASSFLPQPEFPESGQHWKRSGSDARGAPRAYCRSSFWKGNRKSTFLECKTRMVRVNVDFNDIVIGNYNDAVTDGL